MLKIVSVSLVLSLCFASSAQKLNLQGKISNSADQPISGAIVTLAGQKLKDTTGADGKFSFDRAVAVSLPEIIPQTEQIWFDNGIVQLALNTSTSVKVVIYDVKGTLIKSEVISNVAAGMYHFNIGNDFKSSNLHVVKVAAGKQIRVFTYIPFGSGSNVRNANTNGAIATISTLAKITNTTDTVKVTATGFEAKSVVISSYENQALDIVLDSIKQGSVGSSGCGKDLSSLKSGTYKINSAGLSRDYIIDIPTNYDKNNPYRLIFGMHCFGSNMQGVQNDKFYQLKRFADSTKTYCIFVAPNGIVTNGNAMWNQGEKDHQFFDDMLKLFKENLCVDTTRIFSCGFSYGAMFTNSLSLNHQDDLRAVACYAPANWNIYLPTNTQKPIAYMSTTGISDESCKWIYNDANKEGGKYCVLTRAEDNGCTIPATITTVRSGSKSHTTLEFQGCKEGYPVVFFSFDGAHQAGPMDGVSGDDSKRSWIPVETWKFFMRF
ncbi:MAG TPA: hypothetical protein VHO70_09630 [Chitinispirillaceae bacterium]|nr:hypothetical protein [Chitinispirillaceae bacterium]